MKKIKSSFENYGFWLGLVVFLIVLWLPIFPSPAIQNMCAVALLMVTWWITEALPLAATALLPLVLFPLLGITSGKEVASVYMNSTIFLFIGGFVLALSMQRWELHTRIALRIISWFHGSSRLMVFGFMLTGAGLSMWISNTATATMLLPIGLAVYARSSNQLNESDRQALLTALMLGIAYSCSIGGTSTLIGTPPNMAMQRIFEITFPSAPEISFSQWLMFALPLSACMLLTTWYIITSRYTGKHFPSLSQANRAVGSKKQAMSYEEKVVAAVFTATAFCWIFRQDIIVGDFIIPGWSRLLEHASLINDGTVAIASALLLFSIPAKNQKKFKKIADVDTISELPWKIVLLFGGGFALARGFTASGLSEFIGQQFIGLQDTSIISLIAATSAMVVFLTEVTSNTATAEMLLPLVASIAKAIEVNPLLLMLPVTLSASMAFMMPVATPPNAIVFASGQLKIRDMVITGFIINLIVIVMITLATYFWGTQIFSIDENVIPAWATEAF
ncbi:MAG: SLC13 family permease [Gammaproteobacteria bacterium]|nr:SLC13 family permease [Gammaproteobacteria bacterium]